MNFTRYRWVMRLCLVCVVVMSGHVSEAKATDYFVAASNGNDGNKGTLSAPFKTLERGVSVLIPGDTLYVRGGTYLGTHNLSDIPNGNSWNQPVSIKRYANEKVVITAESFRSVLYFNNGSHYIIVDGFIFDAKGGANGIQFGPQSHHIRILNSEIMNSREQGILATEPSNDLEFIKLKIHDNGTHAGQDHGIYIAGSNNLIEGCDIYKNAARGIQIFSTAYTPNKMVVRNNRVHDNGVLGVSGFGIGIYKGTDHQVYNNLVWGNNMGIVVWSGTSNAKVFNNTVHANSLYGIWLASGSQNTHVKNNIASLNGGNGIIITKGSGNAQIYNNLVAATNSGTGLKNWEGSATLKGNLTGSINDIKYANHQNRDFHIQQGSLAIAAGVVLSEVKNDFDYASRNSNGYDIGAFSFNGTPPPANSTPPPSTSTPPPPSSTPPPSSSPSSPSSSSNSISNLTVASGRAYVVPASGLQAGARVYIDRAYTFKTVPSSVQGGAYIQTANDDKAGTSSASIRFTVNQPVLVYVAHGDRISSKPSWLSAFTDTGANLVTTDATFSLFVRSFPAGTVTLGGNASGGCCSMYSVVVKPQSGSASTPPPPPPASSSSSFSVSNLTVASGQSYVVPTSGLQAGARVYIDRAYTFKTVPSNVQGGTYIQTANSDKTATTSTFLRFTVTQPVSVYVAHDGRHPLPSWMSIFTDTGANLVTSDTTLDLFVRTFPAGTITLGGNASSGGSMYSVILKQ